MEQGESAMLVIETNSRIEEGIRAMVKLIRKGKSKYHSKAASRKNPIVSFVKRRDT